MPKTRHYGKPFAPYKKPAKSTTKTTTKATTKKAPTRKAVTRKAATKVSGTASTRKVAKPTGIKKPFKVSAKSTAGIIVERQKKQATRINKMFQ